MANEDLANVIHVTIAIIESSNATPRQEKGRKRERDQKMEWQIQFVNTAAKYTFSTQKQPIIITQVHSSSIGKGSNPAAKNQFLGYWMCREQRWLLVWRLGWSLQEEAKDIGLDFSTLLT
jgi:hypothetical protein